MFIAFALKVYAVPVVSPVTEIGDAEPVPLRSGLVIVPSTKALT